MPLFLKRWMKFQPRLPKTVKTSAKSLPTFNHKRYHCQSEYSNAINNADSALYYTSQIMGKINKGQGTMGMLAKDTALYNRLSGASEHLDNCWKISSLHPKRYVHFSVFGKKD